jgi:hypothetical protein
MRFIDQKALSLVKLDVVLYQYPTWWVNRNSSSQLLEVVSLKCSHKTSKIWHQKLSDIKNFKRARIGNELIPNLAPFEDNWHSRTADVLKCSQSITVSEVREYSLRRAGWSALNRGDMQSISVMWRGKSWGLSNPPRAGDSCV